MVLSRRTPKSTMNYALAFVINELESSSICWGYRAMHQKLLMNGLIIDYKSVRLVLKELVVSLGVSIFLPALSKIGI